MTVCSPIKDLSTINNIKQLFTSKNMTRELLLFELAINTGLNLKDLLALKVKDVKNKHYIVNDGKTFPINDYFRNAIARFVKKRNPDDFLFQGRIHKPIDRTAIFHSFRAICDELALPESISVASWRKTFAYHHYLKYKDLSYLQWLFNQTSVILTLKFIGVEENMNLRFREGVGL